MKCPKCMADTRVIDSRDRVESNQKSRRRICENGHRFSTIELSMEDNEGGVKQQAIRRIRHMGEEKVAAFLLLTSV